MLDEETPELITIEEGVRISYQTMLITHSGLDKKIGPIHIGRQAWVGAGCIILPDVTIGAYAVVGAGSLVHHDVKEDTTVFGVPAKVIKRSGVPKEWIYVTPENYRAVMAAPRAARRRPAGCHLRRRRPATPRSPRRDEGPGDHRGIPVSGHRRLADPGAVAPPGARAAAPRHAVLVRAISRRSSGPGGDARVVRTRFTGCRGPRATGAEAPAGSRGNRHRSRSSTTGRPT